MHEHYQGSARYLDTATAEPGMSKRFFDISVWEKPWYRKLSPAEKCAWNYITARCDNIGVWTPDFELAEFYIGEAIDWESFREKVNGNIEIVGGKWWLVDFVDFQYGDLRDEANVNDKARQSYVRLLKSSGLWESYQGATKGLTRGLYAHKEKDKDKEKEKDKEEVVEIGDHFTVTASQWQRFTADYYETDLTDLAERMNDWIDAKHGGKSPYKDYAAALRTWIKKANLSKRMKETPSPLEQARREAH